MTSPEERQVSICMRKYNLEEIENEFVTHHLSAFPFLEEENKQHTLKILNALREARSVNAEIKLLKQENGLLTSQRARLQRKCNEITKMVEKINEESLELEQLIRQEEIDSSLDICQYEAELGEIINKCRQYANIYNEELIRGETEKANNILSDLVAEEKIRRIEVAEINNALCDMKTDVPENICEIMYVLSSSSHHKRPP
ncbi:jg16351 [Pararge aegeria aegeria]|uniref:Jg16351 protein n=1 Tax=Pararge aegeria aegeria TaxID=348720 RepID=A0A8S4RWB6_9NEOP|nr:jg16351 [Pararge aegeria aegeria]